MNQTMRQTTMWLLLLVGGIALALPSLLQGEEDVPSSLPAELGWGKFRITAGRLHVFAMGNREGKTFESSNPLTGESESFRMSTSAGSMFAQYHLNSPMQRLSMQFDSPSSVVIQRIPGEEGDLLPLEYLQPRTGPVEFSVGEGRNLRKYKAASFWHLMMLAEDDVEQHLLPILASLRPGWQLSKTRNGIEHALVQLAQTGVLPDRAAWAELVEQLGSSKFNERRQAERKLRAIGPSVVAYLKTIPLQDLDAERRVRVGNLLQSLSSSDDDTPARIAMWLIDDSLLWVTVLKSDKTEIRTVAKSQLEKLLQQPITFDINGTKEQRSAQIKAIRAMIPQK